MKKESLQFHQSVLTTDNTVWLCVPGGIVLCKHVLSGKNRFIVYILL